MDRQHHKLSSQYRDREEYQLARALLADVCVATQADATAGPAVERLRRSAVELPGLFLPSRRQVSTSQASDSQRLVLRTLAAALDEASDSGALDPDCVQRLAAKHRELLAQVECGAGPEQLPQHGLDRQTI